MDELTGFRRRLLEIVEEASVRRKVDADRRHAFRMNWDSIRGSVVRAALNSVCAQLPSLSRECGGSYVEYFNGGIRLATKLRGAHSQVTFHPDRDLWHVTFDATPFPFLRESFTLDALTQDAVEFKLLRFLEETCAHLLEVH